MAIRRHASEGLGMKLLWAAIVALGTVSFAIVALSRGESVNAAWLVIAAVCTYVIAYRFYGLFVADKVLGVDPARQTPARRHMTGWIMSRPCLLYTSDAADE